jgi:hypothetical protein
MVGFFVGGMDTVIGAGNLITIAVLTLIGLPPIKAVATMQLVTFFQLTSATILFARKKLINWRQALYFAFLGGIGSFIGANLLLSINESIVSTIAGSIMLTLLIVIPFFEVREEPEIIGIFKNLYNRLFDKRPIITHKFASKLALGSIAFVLGIYGGFYGAGRGLMMLLLFYLIGDAKLITTSANIKPMDTLLSLISAAVFLQIENIINWEIALPLTASSIAGSFFGVNLAQKIGMKKLRFFLYAITVISAIKLIFFT